MDQPTHPSRPETEHTWFIVGRWQEYEGEARANLLRIVAIVAFYVVELVNYHGFKLGFLELPPVAGVTGPFHQAITALAVAWTMLALGVHLCLRLHVFPAYLKYLSTGGDAILLTAILTVADGPSSPLVVAYFLLIGLSGLRFHLPLVWFATAATLAGYLFLLGHSKWFREATRVPRYHQIIFLVAVVMTGVLIGQIVRRVRWAAEEYAERLGLGSEGAA